MKNISRCFLITTILVLGVISGVAAQDWVKVAPKGKDVKADNNIVRMVEVTLAPGDKEPVHSHPAHVYYALTEGKMKVTYADGKTENYDLKPGECGYSDAERPHSTENVGDKTIKFLLVELKEHPYKEAKK